MSLLRARLPLCCSAWVWLWDFEGFTPVRGAWEAALGLLQVAGRALCELEASGDLASNSSLGLWLALDLLAVEFPPQGLLSWVGKLVSWLPRHCLGAGAWAGLGTVGSSRGK